MINFLFQSDTVKYILSIYAMKDFYHLYVKKSKNNDKYSLGQVKTGEKYFNTPKEIINFYRLNKLTCVNKANKIVKVVLIPIVQKL